MTKLLLISMLLFGCSHRCYKYEKIVSIKGCFSRSIYCVVVLENGQEIKERNPTIGNIVKVPKQCGNKK